MTLHPSLEHLIREAADWATLWQLGILVACALLAQLLARGVARRRRGRLLERERRQAAAADPATFGATATDPGARAATLAVDRARQAVEAGAAVLTRLTMPLIMLALVFVVRPVVATFGPASLLEVAIVLLTALVIVRALALVMARAFPQAQWVRTFMRVAGSVVMIGMALHLAGLADPVREALASVSLPVGGGRITLLNVTEGVGSLGVTLVVALWLGHMLSGRVMAAQGIDSSIRVMLARIIQAVLIVVGVLIGLSLVGIDLTVLSVFGGALGVGLGLGLQRIASNYVSGFIVLLERAVRIGDQVSVTGFSGRVTAIRTRYTVMRSSDGTESLIPNETLVVQPVQNQSQADPKTRIPVTVRVGYDADVEQALALLVASAGGASRVLADPAPQAFVSALAPDAVELELGIWVVDAIAKGTLDVRSEVQRAILGNFRQAGIAFAPPRRRVTVDEAGNVTGEAASDDHGDGGGPPRPGRGVS